MRERRLILEQQLSHLEAERESIGEAILEINRRLAVLGEVEGWNLIIEPADAAEFTATDQMEFDSEESIEWVEPAYPLQEGMDRAGL